MLNSDYILFLARVKKVSIGNDCMSRAELVNDGFLSELKDVR